MSTTTTKNSTIFRLGDLPKNVADRVSRLPREVAGGLSERGREVWLAGLGALAATGDEGTTLFQSLVKQGEKLVERGEQVEAEGKRAIETRMESVRGEVQARRHEVADRMEKVESDVTGSVAVALRRLGVPTRAEVEELSAGVAALNERVEALLRRLEERGTEDARAVYTVSAREEGWALEREGLAYPVSLHATKDEALEKARAVAAQGAPSQLVVLRKDGTVQDTFTYEG